jgi:hypothetical protein
MSLCGIVYCKCMCTFPLVRDGFCTHLFVVLVTSGFMNKTAPLITKFCCPVPDFPAASYALPYITFTQVWQLGTFSTTGAKNPTKSFIYSGIVQSIYTAQKNKGNT